MTAQVPGLESRQESFQAGQNAGFDPEKAGVEYQPNWKIPGMGTGAQDQARLMPGMNGRVLVLPSVNGQTPKNQQAQMKFKAE